MPKPYVTGNKLLASDLNFDFKFGGNGDDGALSITSGTTTISAASAQVLVKNYTSISITGTGVLAFSNPHTNGTFIDLRSQGNVTITSSATPAIDLRNMGGQGGGGGAGGSNGGVGSAGTAGSQGTLIADDDTHNGTGGSAASESASGGGGTGGSIFDNLFLYSRNSSIAGKLSRVGVFLATGSGGGGGGGGESDQASGATAGAGGDGGDGAGALIIECGGDLNITSEFNASGENGSDGTRPSVTTENLGGGGGGGGGSSGMVIVIYNGSLTANTATIVGTGGAGGDGNFGKDTADGAHSGGGGAGAGSYSGAGGGGGAGSSGTGTGGSAAGGLGAGGGGGGGSNDGSTQASGGSAGGDDTSALTVLQNREL